MMSCGVRSEAASGTLPLNRAPQKSRTMVAGMRTLSGITGADAIARMVFPSRQAFIDVSSAFSPILTTFWGAAAGGSTTVTTAGTDTGTVPQAASVPQKKIAAAMREAYCILITSQSKLWHARFGAFLNRQKAITMSDDTQGMLTARRDALAARQMEIDATIQGFITELREIAEEAAAIEAYFAAKSPKAAKQARSAGGARRKRGSRKAEILAALANNPSGATRADLLTYLEAPGDGQDAMSVSNALTNMKRAGLVDRASDGRWVATEAGQAKVQPAAE
jgi:DNA-binding transcriptional ArsR family regulator